MSKVGMTIHDVGSVWIKRRVDEDGAYSVYHVVVYGLDGEEIVDMTLFGDANGIDVTSTRESNE